MESAFLSFRLIKLLRILFRFELAFLNAVAATDSVIGNVDAVDF